MPEKNANESSQKLSKIDKLKKQFAKSFRGKEFINGEKVKVAESINKIFGKGWAEPLTENDKRNWAFIRATLRPEIPESYPNPSVIWGRLKSAALKDD